MKNTLKAVGLSALVFSGPLWIIGMCYITFYSSHTKVGEHLYMHNQGEYLEFMFRKKVGIDFDVDGIIDCQMHYSFICRPGGIQRISDKKSRHWDSKMQIAYEDVYGDL